MLQSIKRRRAKRKLKKKNENSETKEKRGEEGERLKVSAINGANVFSTADIIRYLRRVDGNYYLTISRKHGE